MIIPVFPICIGSECTHCNHKYIRNGNAFNKNESLCFNVKVTFSYCFLFLLLLLYLYYFSIAAIGFVFDKINMFDNGRGRDNNREERKPLPPTTLHRSCGTKI